MDVKIIVEGIADQKFIKDYVKFIFDRELKINDDIIQANGWTTLASKEGEITRTQMHRNTDNEGINLIIFDTDANFTERKNDINQWKSDYQLEFELFLFPKNNENETGELEDLLEKIINPDNQSIFDCWKRYEQCLTGVSENREQPLTIPAKKSRIYAYLETLVGESRTEKNKIKDKERDFLNHYHWDLESKALQPLKDFLTGYLT